MKRHNLYEIDLEGLTAFCTVCGYTEIVLPKTRLNKKPKPLCIARAREKREKQRQKTELAREERRAGTGGRQRHSLSNINPKAMTAVCSICGPTNIWKHSNSYKGRTYYSCGTRNRNYLRKYSRAHRAGRSTNPHALSQVDEEAGTAVCATCGSVKVEIRRANKYVTVRCINAIKPDRSRK